MKKLITILPSDVYENEHLDTTQNAKFLLLIIFVLVINFRRDKTQQYGSPIFF